MQPARAYKPAATARCRSVVVRAHKEGDIVLRSLSQLGEVAVLVVDGRQLVSEAAGRHQTSPTATAALGRALLGALLMGCFRKDEEVIQVNFKGDGPLGGILAIADTKGNVKGKVGNNRVDPPLRPDGKLNVGAAVGQGTLSVVRTHPLEPQPYTGMVPLVSGEIAEDLAAYMADSEQTNSALALGVSISTADCSVRSAGGYMIQVLPFCSDETLAALEANLNGMPSVTAMLNSGASPQDITARILDGIGAGDLVQRVEPRYGPCDAEALKGRMMRAVASLGDKEVKDIMAKEGKIEVTCELCNETYQFSEDAILQMTS